MALNALFVGATGLVANSAGLDIVSNNLANLNTTGFKTQRLLFKDVVYQTLAAGTAGTAAAGGTNPQQVGFGVNVGAIDSLLQQGTVTQTGRGLDAAIQGGGFFVLSDGTQTLYTRAGAFAIDSAGFLVDPATGNRVQRFGTVGDAGFQTAGDLNIRVPIGAGLTGTPTTSVNLQGNLSSALAVDGTATTAIDVFDSQSAKRSLRLTFTKTDVNTFDVTAAVAGGTATVGAGTVTFDTSGVLMSPATIDVAVTGLPGAADQTITLNLGTPGQTTGLTQFGGATTAAATTQDGTGGGTLTDVTFDAAGNVVGTFSNGRTIPLAQLAFAQFTNPGGLIRDGLNNFLSSASSGQPLVGPAGQGGVGSVQGGALEGANVDVASEFARLIIAQRGFQVNARTITAANDTLQELANIIR